MLQKTGDENFFFEGSPTGFNLIDFWKWQSSDLLNNTLRGVLAEFIVAKALEIKTDKPRIDWDAYDLLFLDRVRLEVKSSAYIQSWAQKVESALRFSVRPTRAWTPEDGYSKEMRRQSDVYIFCVFSERDTNVADPLCLEQWLFYPVLTEKIDYMLKEQKSASLATIKSLCPKPYQYNELRNAVLWVSSEFTDYEALNRIDSLRALKQVYAKG